MFKLLTPPVDISRYIGGGKTTHVADGGMWRDNPPNKDECQFCFDFVINTALKLQEFDFEVVDFIPSGITSPGRITIRPRNVLTDDVGSPEGLSATT